MFVLSSWYLIVICDYKQMSTFGMFLLPSFEFAMFMLQVLNMSIFSLLPWCVYLLADVMCSVGIPNVVDVV